MVNWNDAICTVDGVFNCVAMRKENDKDAQTVAFVGKEHIAVGAQQEYRYNDDGTPHYCFDLPTIRNAVKSDFA